VVLTLLLVGCGGRVVSNEPEVKAYLNSVYSQSPDIGTYRTGPQLVSLGEAVCSDFASGAGMEQVADRVPLVEGNVTLPASDLGIVISAAVSSLCPKFRRVLSQS
jgi:hypothetical protein